MNNWANSNPDEAAAGVEPSGDFVGEAIADDVRRGLVREDGPRYQPIGLDSADWGGIADTVIGRPVGDMYSTTVDGEDWREKRQHEIDRLNRVEAHHAAGQASAPQPDESELRLPAEARRLSELVRAASVNPEGIDLHGVASDLWQLAATLANTKPEGDETDKEKGRSDERPGVPVETIEPESRVAGYEPDDGLPSWASVEHIYELLRMVWQIEIEPSERTFPTLTYRIQATPNSGIAEYEINSTDEFMEMLCEEAERCAGPLPGLTRPEHPKLTATRATASSEADHDAGGEADSNPEAPADGDEAIRLTERALLKADDELRRGGTHRDAFAILNDAMNDLRRLLIRSVTATPDHPEAPEGEDA